VETVIDGVFIAGAAQGPKTLAESVTSALAAVSKGAALLLKGYVDLPPIVATVDRDRCTWCGECEAACPYQGAVMKVAEGDRSVAEIQPALCKGCGGCVPVCTPQAIDLAGFTNAQVTAMIDALAAEAA
ncbi:MAG TPA: 4Fe-4S dicluster domain-containing protein, partial [Gemmatimonadales bacterium]|nr:4Fe-4S dicluster domain-containing protein [Gemmatimonadales bacterium]